MYPVPHPGRWSGQFSALTDIAFDSLTWGNIVLRFLDAKNDPVKLRAFNNEILGIPEPIVRSDDGTLTGIIPLLSSQVSYIGMTADNQKDTVKYRVRAYGKDGRSYLLDYGRFPAQPGFPELRTYLNTQLFTTLDGVSSPIYKCYMDIQGTRWYDAIDLCLAEPGRIIATARAKESLQTTDRVWPVKVNAKSGRPLYCLYFDHNFWAGRLYRETIQHFDPKRHGPYAPATYFATDTGDDYFHELMQEHEVWKNRKTIWEKVSQSAVNDFGDCEKIGLVQDWCVRLSKEAPDYLLQGKAHGAPQDGG